VTSTQVYIIERRPQPRRWCQFRSQASVSRTWCFNTHVPAGVIHHHLGWPQNYGVTASRDQRR